MQQPTLKCLIFDVDGTLADTESVHRDAFNHAFKELGLDWHWDEKLYTDLLEISGGKERVRHYWLQVNPGVRAIEAQAMQHREDKKLCRKICVVTGHHGSPGTRNT